MTGPGILETNVRAQASSPWYPFDPNHSQNRLLDYILRRLGCVPVCCLIFILLLNRFKLSLAFQTYEDLSSTEILLLGSPLFYSPSAAPTWGPWGIPWPKAEVRIFCGDGIAHFVLAKLANVSPITRVYGGYIFTICPYQSVWFLNQLRIVVRAPPGSPGTSFPKCVAMLSLPGVFLWHHHSTRWCPPGIGCCKMVYKPLN